MANIWMRKSIAVLQAEAKAGEFGSMPGEPGLHRTLSLTSIVALGIGCVIGAGIFVLTGHAAAAHAGPADQPVVRSRGPRLRLRGPLLCGNGLDRARRRAAPIPMPMRPWANSSPGSSAGT